MKITKIKVQGLYGLHDYEIPFEASLNIKIIHAPNGYGKTTLLKLISDIINCRLFEISLIPFKSFKLEFDNLVVIEVVKEDEKQADKEDIVKYIVSRGQEKKEYQLASRINYGCMIESKMSMNTIEKSLPFLKRITQTTWYDTKLNQKISYDEIVANYGELLFIDKELRDVLSEIKEKMPVHFIHANRLVEAYEMGEGRSLTRRKSLVPSVIVYSKELAETIAGTLARSAALNQELDRTFPARLVKEMTDGDSTLHLNDEIIHRELEKLEKRRVKLQEVGLLPHSDLTGLLETKQLDKPILKVLNLYIKDSQKKLDVFNQLETKINLMCEIINKRFNYKTMKIGKQGNFVFELPDKTLLTPDKLSSGEQNELILIFELLFKSQTNSLILIDEPEISLHIAWQQQFLEDMEAISALTDVKVIIATHSPDIINGRWDLTTGLEEC